MRNDWNIKDDEIRIIGSDRTEDASGRREDRARTAPTRTGKARTLFRLLGILAILLVAGGLLFLLSGKRRSAGRPDPPGVFEPLDTARSGTSPAAAAPLPFGDYSDTSGRAYTEILQKTVNDIPLTLCIPHNAVPELCLGAPDPGDPDIILAAQAADIRRDNLKIVGAFVLKGEPLAWGLSKRGYCGIIDGEMTVGVADNSPLFEQATETGGYFFRQYPLVDNGRLVENEPKNKALRKALCVRAGETFVVRSEAPESFHDFAQALADLGVENAIYLVGSTSYGFLRDRDGSVEEFTERRVSKYRYENYVLWREKR